MIHVRKVKTGPYVGRYIVWSDRDEMLAGYGRRPFYGQIERSGRSWLIFVPGQGDKPVGTYGSRAAAAEALYKLGRSA